MHTLKRGLKLLFVIGLSGLLAACAGYTPPTGDTTSLDGLQTMTGGSGTAPVSKVNHIRRMALRETAMSIGAQAGLAYRSNAVDGLLKKDQLYLNRIYDFNQLLLPHDVLPPILLEGRDTLNLAGHRVIRLADRSYRIEQQAHFVTAAPNWRNYLWMDYATPDRPNNSLLPKNKIEQEIWSHDVSKGWQEGINQANTIFDQDLARLTSNYNGIVLYRILLKQHIVSAPFVASTHLGVTGGGNHLNVDDQVLRITALPELNNRSQQWRPAISK